MPNFIYLSYLCVDLEWNPPGGISWGGRLKDVQHDFLNHHIFFYFNVDCNFTVRRKNYEMMDKLFLFPLTPLDLVSITYHKVCFSVFDMKCSIIHVIMILNLLFLFHPGCTPHSTRYWGEKHFQSYEPAVCKHTHVRTSGVRRELALINWAGGLYERILTNVVSTDRMQWSLYSQLRSRFSLRHLIWYMYI